MPLGRRMDKLRHSQRVEYYSALKRNALSSREKTQRNLKGILLCERSQSEKATLWFQLYEIVEKGKTMKTVKRSVVASVGTGAEG